MPNMLNSEDESIPEKISKGVLLLPPVTTNPSELQGLIVTPLTIISRLNGLDKQQICLYDRKSVLIFAIMLT
jgi:hypothetical protein